MKRRTVRRNGSWSSLNSSRLITGVSVVLVRLGQVQHLLGDERKNQLLGDRRDPRDRHFTQQPLDVVFLRVTKPAMRQNGLQAGVVTGACAEEFRRVRFGAARLVVVVQP